MIFFILYIILILGPIIRICKTNKNLDISPIMLLAINLETNLNILYTCFLVLTPRIRKYLRRFWSVACITTNQYIYSESSNNKVVLDPEKVIYRMENKIRRDDKLVGFNSRNVTGTSSDNLIKNEGIII
jgi:hypothetical protein